MRWGRSLPGCFGMFSFHEYVKIGLFLFYGELKCNSKRGIRTCKMVNIHI